MTDDATPTPPLPEPDGDSVVFWDGLKEHRVLVQRCGDCGHQQLYFRAMCRRCWSREVEAVEVSGRGRVYSYTILRRVGDPYLAHAAPYALAIVELDEGPRIVGRVEGDPQEVRCDAPVTPVFHDLDGTTLLHFAMADR